MAENLIEKTWKVLTHEVTLIATPLLYLFGFLDPIFQILQSTSGLWFPIISVGASQILPVFDVSQETIQMVIIAGSIIYVFVLAEKLHDRLDRKI